MPDPTSILFLGESPPLNAPPRFRPFDCASGTRLAALLGLQDRENLLRVVPMTNVYSTPHGVPGAPTWPARIDAEVQAAEEVSQHPHARVIVTLGRRVTRALHGGDPPALVSWCDAGRRFIPAPHPSGRSSTLNNPDHRAEVRRALLPELILGCPDLRATDLADDDALQDWAHAVAPAYPAAGLAALEHLRGREHVRLARLSSPLLDRIANDAHVCAEGPPPQWQLRDLAFALLNGERGIATAATLLACPLEAMAKPARARVTTHPADAARATLATYRARLAGAP